MGFSSTPQLSVWTLNPPLENAPEDSSPWTVDWSHLQPSWRCSISRRMMPTCWSWTPVHVDWWHLTRYRMFSCFWSAVASHFPVSYKVPARVQMQHQATLCLSCWPSQRCCQKQIRKLVNDSVHSRCSSGLSVLASDTIEEVSENQRLSYWYCYVFIFDYWRHAPCCLIWPNSMYRLTLEVRMRANVCLAWSDHQPIPRNGNLTLAFHHVEHTKNKRLLALSPLQTETLHTTKPSSYSEWLCRWHYSC